MKLYDSDGAIYRDNEPRADGMISSNLDQLIGSMTEVYWRKVNEKFTGIVMMELIFKGWPAPEKHFIDIIIGYYKKIGRDVIPRIAEIKLYEPAKK